MVRAKENSKNEKFRFFKQQNNLTNISHEWRKSKSIANEEDRIYHIN
jgi:hypothetical protein